MPPLTHVHMPLIRTSFQVHVANWHGKRVVVKAARGLLTDADPPGASARHLESELRILEQLHHPNTVRLLGAGHTPEGRRFLILEHLSGGTLGGARGAAEQGEGGVSTDATCDDARSLSSSLFGPIRRRRAAASLAEAVERALQVRALRLRSEVCVVVHEGR